MPQLRRPEILLILLAIAVRLIFHLLTGFLADDAFITFRYALNFGAGNGFVYNPGEHVLGTTTPLFAFLLTVLTIPRIDPPNGALIISFLCAGITAVLLYRLAQSLRFTRLAFIPALCYVLWPRSIVADSSGMETALFTMLVTLAFYYRHRRQEVYALGSATLATLTRPEGLILLTMLLAYDLIKDRSQWARYLAVPSVILLPWVVIATIYFGSSIPNSLSAKAALYSRFGAMSLWEKTTLVLGWNSWLGILLVPLVAIGARWLWQKQFYGRMELCWLVAMGAFYVFVPARLFFWYVAPIYPILLLFLGALFIESFENAPWIGERRALSAAVLGIAIAALLIGYDSRPVASFRAAQQTQEEVHRKIGEYLLDVADPEDVVAAEDIGYMGYYSKLRILDRDGLVSPEVLPYNKSGQYGQVVADFRPNWVVAAVGSPMSGFIIDTVFLRSYAEAAEFSHAAIQYKVFKRSASR
jgi:hypothetical protein